MDAPLLSVLTYVNFPLLKLIDKYLYVFTDAWEINLDINSNFGQNFRSTNARKFENVWRLDCSAVYDEMLGSHWAYTGS